MKSWLMVIADGSRTLLGAILLWAASAKITQVEVLPNGPAVGSRVLAHVIGRQGLIPHSLAEYAAVLVIAAEIVIALWLLLHWRTRAAGFMAGLLLICCSIYMLVVGWRQGQVACNCFGTLSSTSLTSLLARNFGLGLLAVLSLMDSARRRVRSA